MQRCLFIAYYFPPGGGVGVQRSLKFVKYLPEMGWKPVVLTAEVPQGIPRDAALVGEVPPEAEVSRVRPIFKTDELSSSAHQSNVLKRILRYALIPDSVVPWIPSALRRAMRIAREQKIVLIYSTSPPNSSHIVGYLLKKWTGLPWVADFRDAWLTDPDRNRRLPTRLRLATVERLQEGLVVRNADRIVAVTAGIREDFLRRYQLADTAVKVITNGYDPSDFPACDRPPGGKFTFTYTGSLVRENRDPRLLFDAVEYLLASHPEIAERFQVVLVGAHSSAHVDLASRREYGGVFRLVGTVPYSESLLYQCRSDANIMLYTGPGDGRERQMMSGKIFDYLGAGRPVLAIVPPGSSVEELVCRLGIGIQVDPSSTKEIAAQMLEMIQGGRGAGLSVDADLLRVFHRRYLTSQMAGVFHELSSPS